MSDTQISDQSELRKTKIDQLRELGINPFPNEFKPTHFINLILENNKDKTKEELEKQDEEYRICGRVISIRDFGKSIFVHLKDMTAKMQIYLQRDIIGKDEINIFKKFIDIGDFICVNGNLFKTKTGELTVNAKKYRLVTKSLHPLPEKFHGLQDVELRYRQRYLDLISNDSTREIFNIRSEVIKLIRNFLDEREFLEVETPILHSIAGGAAAKPFKTYHNALDMELFLRIAPELYLKRLVVGGLERVYELGRTFRNEGVSTKHNPEFTMIELYQAYATYDDLMNMIEEMLCNVINKINNSLEINYGNSEINFTRPWKRINIYESIKEKLGSEVLENDNLLYDKADALSIEHHGIRGKAIVELFELLIGEKLIHPTFVYGYPVDVSPLARKNNENPEITDRFELYINGWEIANAFSELNDPIDQKERLLTQLENRKKGDEESQEIDEEFIRALEYGMPPTAGAGIGIDRLVMLLTDSQSIREVIFFPHLRP